MNEQKARIERKYGKYTLIQIFFNKYCQTEVWDFSNFKFPLIMSITQTKEEAGAYRNIFETCGYIPVMGRRYERI